MIFRPLPLSIACLILLQQTSSLPTIVQTLSSRFETSLAITAQKISYVISWGIIDDHHGPLFIRFALVLGGFGPGYTELQEVEVVKHTK